MNLIYKKIFQGELIKYTKMKLIFHNKILMNVGCSESSEFIKGNGQENIHQYIYTDKCKYMMVIMFTKWVRITKLTHNCS